MHTNMSFIFVSCMRGYAELNKQQMICDKKNSHYLVLKML